MPDNAKQNAAVLVVGVAVADYVFYVDTFPGAAQKYAARDALIVGGGCGGNAAVAVSRLGGQAFLSTRLGDDGTGDIIVQGLEDERVNLSLTDRSGERSSCSSILIDAAGERQIVNFRGRGLTNATSRLTDAPDVGAVLADTRWSAGAVAAMELARKRGIPGVLDIEAGADPACFAPASHLAFSMQGLKSACPDMSPDAALARIVTEHGGWACVTLGEEGVLVHSKGRVERIPGNPVAAVDTLGAGDVWHGAFALRLAEGADEITAVRFANAAAALKCMRTGGRAGTPVRTEVDIFMREAAT